MTQEEKDLIVKDLSSRIPYGVMVYIEFDDGKIFKIRKFAPKMIHDYLKLSLDKVIFKPYLRPMSNMTEEEKQIMDKLWKENNKLVFADSDEIRRYRFYDISVVDFLNSHHFDYRGLIPMGLAIEAPKGMYNTKQ